MARLRVRLWIHPDYQAWCDKVWDTHHHRSGFESHAPTTTVIWSAFAYGYQGEPG